MVPPLRRLSSSGASPSSLSFPPLLTSFPQEGDQFCSDACRDLHRADKLPLVIPSRPSSPALSDPSDPGFPLPSPFRR
ncbi:uncharacterized protein PHACADRAFT_263645 [Phanerochaete carnosa HHB-10118-sp]|uniref:Uncharacterized protein n=1 Tax=Phanerochaete carnosa (strain HHB-10118-sp) TaxID=650164 RepID=K5WJH0_PHACS|nr:uncharacterized protein PHACADRAFT_263645 [Phanerochaete carnosa HHB-10118-sp]EKM50377.1 hypothetical protein PHACADRAFT_263645 [Phanerochaete carnosa HHB-10118-sp]